MMEKRPILLIDAIINLVLGILLVSFLPDVVSFLGVPMVQEPFYATILGSVLFGIGIALLIEYFREGSGLVGLGLGGAISINLCGGFVLGTLLIRNRLNIPSHGRLFLWFLVLLLVGISLLECTMCFRKAEIIDTDKKDVEK